MRRTTYSLPLEQYDWCEIQEYYDKGNNYSDVTKKFQISRFKLGEAKELGLFKSRTRSEANKLSIKLGRKKPYKHTEETKRKLSAIRTKYLQDNPDKVPYKIHKPNSERSYPEKYFAKWLEKENINFEIGVRVGLYELDFLIDGILDLEIDGNQHHTDPKRVESDKRRNKYLSDLGYDIIRVRWHYFNNLDRDCKEKYLYDLLSMIKPNGNGKPYSGKGRTLPLRNKSKVIKCNYCGAETNNPKFCSSSCSGKSNKGKNTKIDWPSPEIVHQMVLETSYTNVAKELEVSISSVRKYLKNNGLLIRKYKVKSENAG